MSLIKIPKNKLDKVDEIAIHNGFEFSQIPTSYTKKDTFLTPQEKEHVIKVFKKNLGKTVKILEPKMLYYDQAILINNEQSSKNKNHKNIGFDIIGIPNGIAEAIIINTATKILKEEGYKNIFIDINCTGDRNSIAKFTDELLSYYKKNTDVLEEGCGGILNKKDVLILDCAHESCQSLKENAPRPINFLSEHSQRHLKEVLEYLEEMGIPYRINNDLMSENNHYSKTIFEIKTEQGRGKKIEEIILARGGRYDEVANRIANKRNLMAVGISLQYRKNKTIQAYSNNIKQPKIFLIQFGFRAKLKSLEIIDMLRKEKITVYQSLHKDKLSDQFDEAKKMKMPFILVIGHQEAQNDEILVKNTKEASQYLVKINKLPQFFRKIKFV